MKKLRLIGYIAIVTVLVLLVPLVAMQFTDEVVWGLSDFGVAGFLLFGSGALYVLVTEKISDGKYKIIVGVLILAVLLLVWAELAVGIFGTPFAGS